MKQILLTHQYAGNKGDRAVLYAMCILIRSLYPTCQIVVSTSHPELWVGYDYYVSNHIKFVPSAWDYSRVGKFGLYWKLLSKIQKYTFTVLRECYLRGGKRFATRLLCNPSFYKEARKSDLIISVGGHHFTTLLSRDIVSSVNFDMMSALSTNKNVICFSQSFGPFVFFNPRNKALTKQLLKDCLLLCPREAKSYRELTNLDKWLRSKIEPTFESVISLNLLFHNRKPISARNKRIGIAIYCTQERTKAAQEKYIDSFSDFCKHANSKGYSVVFFPMEIKGTGPDDRVLINEIISRVGSSENSVIDEDLQTLEHLREVECCSMFIGHKTHSTIFALATGTPLIAIAYHPKTIEFMSQYGMDEYAISEDKLSFQNLIVLFEKMEPNAERISSDIFKKSKHYALQIKDNLQSACNHISDRL